MRRPPLWKCPKCGHRFVTKNLWHSCGKYALADHFKGKAPNVRKAFDRLAAIARSLGPVTIYAQKTRIVIMGRVRFSGGQTRKHWFQAALWLKRRAEHPTLAKIEDYGALAQVHYFKVRDPAELDTDFVALMKEAYRIGKQET